MLKKLLPPLAAVVALSGPAFADPAIGFGLTVTFGGGGVDYGVGARVFSNDEEDEFAATLGVDYMFKSKSWRGSIGAAYMMDDSYLEINGGYKFNGDGFDFGFGGGWADTEDDEPVSMPVMEQPAAPAATTGGGRTQRDHLILLGQIMVERAAKHNFNMLTEAKPRSGGVFL